MDPFKSLNVSTDRNLPLPDQLYEIRQEIRSLKADENKMVELLKELGSTMGAEYNAEVKTQESNNLDKKAVVEHYGEELKPFYKKTEYKKVILKKNTE